MQTTERRYPTTSFWFVNQPLVRHPQGAAVTWCALLALAVYLTAHSVLNASSRLWQTPSLRVCGAVHSTRAAGRLQVLYWLFAGLVLLLLWPAWRKWRRCQELVLPKHPPGQTVSSLGSACGLACDVFICHRGPEVKRSIVGHIKERLQRANLSVFVDYEM